MTITPNTKIFVYRVFHCEECKERLDQWQHPFDDADICAAHSYLIDAIDSTWDNAEVFASTRLLPNSLDGVAVTLKTILDEQIAKNNLAGFLREINLSNRVKGICLVAENSELDQ